MKLVLNKQIDKPIIIQGFPGFGLIGPIVTEYLIDHLGAEKIGSIIVDEMVPLVAIHQGDVVDPVGLYYSEKYNVILIHVVQNIVGAEWKFLEVMKELVQKTNAWKIISIEGVVNPSEETLLYHYESEANSEEEKLAQAGVEKLQDGIVMGVSATLIQEITPLTNLLVLFATTHSQMPDSRAAAKLVGALDVLLNLEVPPEPLYDKAAEFEQKFQQMMDSVQETQSVKEKKVMNYVG